MVAEFKEFDPLDYNNLAKDCVRELKRQPAVPLNFPKSFPGAGVYALFYRGDSELYRPIRSESEKAIWPIYVGKAEPTGGRTGAKSTGVSSALFKRLKEHRESIAAAENLKVEDFLCCYLAVKPLWITMAEGLLIREYQPVWNVRLAGFGIHNPGKGREKGERSWWDTLHPGRPFAKPLKATRDPAEAEARVREFLKNHNPYVRKMPPLKGDPIIFMEDENVED